MFWIDAFASRPFAGNRAVVCLCEAPRSARWMQALAAEFAAPETAFVQRRPAGFSLRWFTPITEVALCGHGTLAAAEAVWQAGWWPRHRPIAFHTRGGILPAAWDGRQVAIVLPRVPVGPLRPPGLLRRAIGVPWRWAGRAGPDVLLELEDEAAVRACEPDLDGLRTLPTRGVIVTAPSSRPEVDFVSRFFAPAVGIPEDPVTGSAHAALGPYWSGRLGRSRLRAAQLSARGGRLEVVVGAADVTLKGSVTTIAAGWLSDGLSAAARR